MRKSFSMDAENLEMAFPVDIKNLYKLSMTELSRWEMGVPIVDHRTSLYDGQLEFADANIAGLITGGIRAATAKDVSGKKAMPSFCSAKTRSSKIGTDTNF